MRFQPGNAQHIGARGSQQDAFGFSDPENTSFVAHGGLVAIVADGMGGMAYGQAASRAATRTFLDAYARKSPQESIPEALERSLRSANEAVLDLAREAGVVGEMGTTVVAAALHEERFFFISAGDSAAYHLRGGRLYSLAVVHTHGADLDQRAFNQQISTEEAAQDPERHALTSFLGLEELVDFDRNFRPLALAPGDRVLICSDGLSKALRKRQIEACLGGNPQAAAERLIHEAISLGRPGQDNTTAIVIACERETHRRSW